VHRKTIVELVQATDHASKMGYQLLIPFTVTNGVRQRGVLSPYLFAVYLDELSIQLGSAIVGCTVGNMVVNHLIFADDICVFSPRICGLQCLLNICGDYCGSSLLKEANRHTFRTTPQKHWSIGMSVACPS